MSKNEIKMYEELLDLLERRYDNKEIDKENYVELKERYLDKLEEAKNAEKLIVKPGQISTSGVHSISDRTVSVAGSTTIKGGKIARDIVIAGAGKFSSDIVCNKLSASGSMRSAGNITAHGNLKSSGLFRCGGFLHGDGDAKFSGTTKINGETVITGRINSAGSFKCQNNIQADKGAKFAGLAKISGDLLSKGIVDIEGRVVLEGNLIGEEVFINKNVSRHKFKKLKRSKVNGSVFAKKNVFLSNTLVKKDIKGVEVVIGPFTRVNGTIYYVDRIDIDDKAKLDKEPVKVSYEELKL